MQFTLPKTGQNYDGMPRQSIVGRSVSVKSMALDEAASFFTSGYRILDHIYVSDTTLVRSTIKKVI